MNSRTIKTRETRAIGYKQVEVEQTYDELRDLFDNDKSCLVIQLLDRIEELEAELALNNQSYNQQIAEEVVWLRAQNEELKDRIKKIIKTIGDFDK